MHTEISHEEITKRYDELAEATELHQEIAHQNIWISSELKREKAQALADKIIEGSNADKREAAFQEHFKQPLMLFEVLKQAEHEAKLRLDLARIRVEELRLHARIAEASQRMEQFNSSMNISLPQADIRYDPTGFEDAYSD